MRKYADRNFEEKPKFISVATIASLVCMHNAWLIGNTQERLAGDCVCFHDIMMLTRNSENSPNDSSLNEGTQG